MADKRVDYLSSISISSKTQKNLVEYLINLVIQGGKIPSANGGINKKAVAEACSFDRQVLDVSRGNPKTIELLKWAEKAIGLESSINFTEEALARYGNDELAKFIEMQKKQIESLQKKLFLSEQENAAKSNEISRLRQQIKVSKIQDDALLSGHDIELL